MNSNKLITILNSQQLIEVQIAKSKLDLVGLKSFLIDENLTSTIGTAYIEGYRLQVNELDVDRANSILNSNN